MSVNLIFEGSVYVPPWGTSVDLIFNNQGAVLQAAELSGFDGFLAGSALVHVRSDVSLGGFNGLGVGVPGVVMTRYVNLLGFDSAALGGLLCSPTQFARPGGLEYTAFGEASAGTRVRQVPLVPFESLGMGDCSLASNRRRVWPSGVDSLAVYQPRVDFADRSLALYGLNGLLPGEPLVYLRNRTLLPVGLDSFRAGLAAVPIRATGSEFLSFGLSKIGELAQSVLLYGGRFTDYGLPNFSRSPRPLGLTGFLSANESGVGNERWGLLEIAFKSAYPVLSGFSATEYGVSGAANRNRVVGLPGFVSGRVSTGLMVELGLAANLSGFDSFLSDRPEVSAFVRSVTLAGMDAPVIMPFTAIANKVPSLFLEGWTRLSFGRPSVVATRQFVFVPGSDYLGVGVPVAGHRVREILPLRVQEGIGLGIPDVEFVNRPVFLKGLNSFKDGLYYLDQIFNRIKPWPDDEFTPGNCSVFNVTPELKLSGAGVLAFGRCGVFFNRVNLPSLFDFAFGRLTVSFANRVMKLAPFNPPPLGQDFSVGPLPTDFPQRVLLSGFDVWNAGYGRVQGNALYLVGFDALETGRLQVVRMGLSEVGISKPLTEFGRMQLSPYYLRMPEDLTDGLTGWGMPSVSPRTVWLEPTGDNEQGLFAAGGSSVTHRIRYLSVVDNHTLKIGSGLEVSFRVRKIQTVKFTLTRWGIQYVGKPGELQGSVFLGVGSPSIAFRQTENPYRALNGVNFAEYGDTTVSLRMRKFLMLGDDQSQYGPFLRLSPPARPVLPGLDVLSMGSARIGYRIRSVSMAGQMFLLAGVLMRVRRGSPLQVGGLRDDGLGVPFVSRAVQPGDLSGLDSFRPGRCGVALATRKLRAFPVLHDFRQCGYPVVTRG